MSPNIRVYNLYIRMIGRVGITTAFNIFYSYLCIKACSSQSSANATGTSEAIYMTYLFRFHSQKVIIGYKVTKKGADTSP